MRTATPTQSHQDDDDRAAACSFVNIVVRLPSCLTPDSGPHDDVCFQAGEEDEVYGDFTDMETGVRVDAEEGDEVTAASLKAIREARAEEVRSKKAETKAAFDAEVGERGASLCSEARPFGVASEGGAGYGTGEEVCSKRGWDAGLLGEAKSPGEGRSCDSDSVSGCF